MKKNTLITIAIAMFIAISCKKEDKKTPLTIPTVYDSTDYSANVATEIDIRNRMVAFVNYMKKGDNVANKLDIDSLNYYFTTGTPSLKSLTPTYYANLIENTWFPNMVAASQNAFDIADAPTDTIGGVYGNRLLDSKGKEIMQEIEKGMFAATFYNYFLSLAQQPNITAATVDKMVCIYGAHPNFPNTNTAINTTTPDALIALYAARRDRTALTTGLYRQIKDEFLKLKAAVNAGSAYNQEKNEAIAALKLLMEKAILSTTINYANAAKTKLDKTSPTLSDKAGALHDLGEGVGFVHGFKAVAQSHRRITDAQISQLLTDLKAPINGSTTMYLFATEHATNITVLNNIKTYIQNIYSFTTTEMADFNFNWINTEGR